MRLYSHYTLCVCVYNASSFSFRLFHLDVVVVVVIFRTRLPQWPLIQFQSTPLKENMIEETTPKDPQSAPLRYEVFFSSCLTGRKEGERQQKNQSNLYIGVYRLRETVASRLGEARAKRAKSVWRERERSLDEWRVCWRCPRARPRHNDFNFDLDQHLNNLTKRFFFGKERSCNKCKVVFHAPIGPDSFWWKRMGRVYAAGWMRTKPATNVVSFSVWHCTWRSRMRRHYTKRGPKRRWLVSGCKRKNRSRQSLSHFIRVRLYTKDKDLNL